MSLCRFLLFSCPANAILASFPELRPGLSPTKKKKVLTLLKTSAPKNMTLLWETILRTHHVSIITNAPKFVTLPQWIQILILSLNLSVLPSPVFNDHFLTSRGWPGRYIFTQGQAIKSETKSVRSQKINKYVVEDFNGVEPVRLYVPYAH